MKAVHLKANNPDCQRLAKDNVLEPLSVFLGYLFLVCFLF
jgi:hypothetical protein